TLFRSLTEQLLALAHASHTTTMSQGQVDLASLGREVVLQYLPLAREHRQDLGWIGPGEDGEQAPLWVYASDAEIHESVSNLIHNAINHAGSGSAITVSAGHDDKQAWISVTDNGMGLAARLRESVFVRFDRGGPARKGGRGSGSGLGLAIARSDAEIHESVSNLIHNAINHAGSGSAITVSAGHDDKQAWISVTDNGMGLAASLRESVFVRFDRGGPARKGGRGSGSGLGLAIALAYAERNGGTIVLTDGEPNDMGGYGLKATLRLPLLQAEAPKPESA